MYHAELCNAHNESMDNFIKLFNDCSIHKNLVMIRNPVETYTHDGLFICMATGKTIGFDWTRSNSELFRTGRFVYRKLACIESKLQIPSSKLFITSDINENQIAVGWHDDFIKEPISYFLFSAVGGEEELRQIRYTKHFETYNYSSIKCFKTMIHKALDNNLYNNEIF